MWELRCFFELLPSSPSLLTLATLSLVIGGGERLLSLSEPHEDDAHSNVSSSVFGSGTPEVRDDTYLALPRPLCDVAGVKLRNEKKAEVKICTASLARPQDDKTEKANLNSGGASLKEPSGVGYWVKYRGKLKHGFEKPKKVAEWLEEDLPVGSVGREALLQYIAEVRAAEKTASCSLPVHRCDDDAQSATTASSCASFSSTSAGGFVTVTLKKSRRCGEVALAAAAGGGEDHVSSSQSVLVAIEETDIIVKPSVPSPLPPNVPVVGGDVVPKNESSLNGSREDESRHKGGGARRRYRSWAVECRDPTVLQAIAALWRDPEQAGLPSDLQVWSYPQFVHAVGYGVLAARL